jgi:lipoprotein-anchoring transpeptidase ErfK/SrfK
MNQLGINKMVAAVMGMVLALGFQLADAQKTTQIVVQPDTNRVIVVSLEDRKLALIENGIVQKTYIVAVGKATTPSPTGTFTIESHIANPTYSHEGRIIPPGPQNPVGSRWMGLSIRGYGIHGTNVPSSIGKAASHGCIRMGKTDVEELFSLVHVGDTVELIGTRNDETAKLFGMPETTSPSAQTQLATASTTATTSLAGSM